MAARKKKAARTKAVATQQKATPQAVQAWEADAGAGLEGAESGDFQTPLLQIVQTNSPIADDGSDQYDPDAKPGMYYDSVTKELVMDPKIIIAAFQMKVLEWKPVDDGGGLVTVHDGRTRLNEQDVVTSDDPKKPRLLVSKDTGHELIETAHYYALCQFKDGWREVVIPLKATGLRASRNLNTLIQQWRPDGWTAPSCPPAFARMYQFSSERKENDSGVFRVASVEATEDLTPGDLYARAKAFREAVSEGAVTAKYEGTDPATADDVPF